MAHLLALAAGVKKEARYLGDGEDRLARAHDLRRQSLQPAAGERVLESPDGANLVLAQTLLVERWQLPSASDAASRRIRRSRSGSPAGGRRTPAARVCPGRGGWRRRSPCRCSRSGTGSGGARLGSASSWPSSESPRRSGWTGARRRGVARRPSWPRSSRAPSCRRTADSRRARRQSGTRERRCLAVERSGPCRRSPALPSQRLRASDRLLLGPAVRASVLPPSPPT